jgi:hypothetical protein
MRVMIALGITVVLLATNLGHCQEQSEIPDEVLKNFRYFVGSWKTTGKVGDVTSEGTWAARWGKGKNCLVRESSYTDDGEMMFGTGLIGWDAAKKCIVEYAFWTNNESYTLLWTLQADGNLDGTLMGVEEGKEFSAKCKVVKNSPSEFVYESKDVSGDDIRVVFQKVPRQKGKKARK